MQKRRVVVTGLGAISPVGNTVQETWNALLEGKSGVDKITLFDTSEHKTQIAGEVKNFNPEDYIDRKEARKLDRFTQLAMVSADEAIKASGLDLEKVNRDRVGVIVGTGIGGMYTFESEHEKLISAGPRRVSPFFIPMMIGDIAAGQISIRYNLKGPNYSTVSACASSGHAVGVSYRTIQYGDADVMVCGGTEAVVTPMAVAGFNNSKALSTNNDEPQKASRPFDAMRDGFVLGEGAGILILEELEHALARGANIIAEVAGIGFTADAFHITQPAPGGEGAVRAMANTLADAGLKPQDVDYINAHGTSTPYNDKNESAAIRQVFGEYADEVAVSSTKSMTGHLLGAAGGMEMIICSLAVKEDHIPPTINYENPDPECDLNYTPNKAAKKTVRAAISNSFGFGGHNTCLAVKKYTG